jgi:clan AA aspartic protease (TIGR02281 family)
MEIKRQSGSNILKFDVENKYTEYILERKEFDLSGRSNKNSNDEAFSLSCKSVAALHLVRNEILKLSIAYKKKINEEFNVKPKDLQKSLDEYNKKTQQQKVNLKKENGVFLIDVEIGKADFVFILDSGASDCHISSSLEQELLKNKVIGIADYLPKGKYQLANGTIVETKRLKLPKVKVGNKIIEDVIVSVGSSVSPNLLGQSFLSKLLNWSIDNTNNTLNFQ